MTITLELLGKQIATLIGEVRSLRESVDGMRSELDGAFHMQRGTDEVVDGLHRIVAAQGQRLTALERGKK
jgi:hypothetical protein